MGFEFLDDSRQKKKDAELNELFKNMVVESKKNEFSNQNKPTDILIEWFISGAIWVLPLCASIFWMRWKRNSMVGSGMVPKTRTSSAIYPSIENENDRMSGWELFLSNASLFVDDTLRLLKNTGEKNKKNKRLNRRQRTKKLRQGQARVVVMLNRVRKKSMMMIWTWIELDELEASLSRTSKQ
ncbi:unnamed protein product [Arabis nemorensis]|uniref:Transmembrane protein n=1 Tax=Arabis nemorensis TaxID=586526 RepID=A0A565BE36_9BRAS|nr:unnamed protein product [Arabis nemorensis]